MSYQEQMLSAIDWLKKNYHGEHIEICVGSAKDLEERIKRVQPNTIMIFKELESKSNASLEVMKKYSRSSP